MTSPPQGGPPSPTCSHPPPRGQAPPSSCQEQAILCQRSPSWSGGCSTISSLFPNPISSNLSSSPPGPPIQVISPLSEHPGEWYSAKSLEVKRLSICLSKRYLASLAWLGKTAIAMALISRYCSHPQIDIGADLIRHSPSLHCIVSLNLRLAGHSAVASWLFVQHRHTTALFSTGEMIFTTKDQEHCQGGNDGRTSWSQQLASGLGRSRWLDLVLLPRVCNVARWP